MKGLAFLAFVVSFASLVPPSVAANPIDDLVSANVHFEIPGTDLIPEVAAVRASCDINVTAERVHLLANESDRSSIDASAGPCTIVLILLGMDVALPVFNSTPLGRSSFYLPGISTVTLGFVDVSLDLVTSMNSTSRVASGIATVSPDAIEWAGWGAKRILIHGEDGVGSIVESELNTTFTYTMSIALTVYAVSIQLHHVDLAQIGSVEGAPSLLTPVSVDLKPHALDLEPPSSVGHDHAVLTWSGTVDPDIDYLELRLSDGTSDIVYRLVPTATSAEVLLRPSTHYVARIVTVDQGGQGSPSDAVEFDSAAAPSSSIPLEAQGNPAVTWTLVALAVVAGIVGYSLGALRGRKGD